MWRTSMEVASPTTDTGSQLDREHRSTWKMHDLLNNNPTALEKTGSRAMAFIQQWHQHVWQPPHLCWRCFGAAKHAAEPL